MNAIQFPLGDDMLGDLLGVIKLRFWDPTGVWWLSMGSDTCYQGMVLGLHWGSWWLSMGSDRWYQSLVLGLHCGRWWLSMGYNTGYQSVGLGPNWARSWLSMGRTLVITVWCWDPIGLVHFFEDPTVTHSWGFLSSQLRTRIFSWCSIDRVQRAEGHFSKKYLQNMQMSAFQTIWSWMVRVTYNPFGGP